MEDKKKAMTPEVKNEELEALVDAYLLEKTPENLNKLVDHITRCRVLIPANSDGKNKPVPCLISNPQNGMFLPIYSCMEQVPREPKSTGIINMPYLNANHMVAQGSEVAGIVINPFSQNLVFKRPLVEKIEEVETQRRVAAQRSGMPMTPEQYRIFERKQFEFGNFPKNFFMKGKELMDELCNRKEAYVDQLFEEGYRENRMYPYLTEDFSVMVMSISSELTVVRVDLPNQDIGTPSCRRVYLVWNEQTNLGRYMTIERTPDENVNLLGEVASDGSHVEHGEAPAEGTELQRIIDLQQE
jgi:hypothetical protein